MILLFTKFDWDEANCSQTNHKSVVFPLETLILAPSCTKNALFTQGLAIVVHFYFYIYMNLSVYPVYASRRSSSYSPFPALNNVVFWDSLGM